MLTVCTNPKCLKDYIIGPGSKGIYCSLSCSTGHQTVIRKQKRIKKYLENPKRCISCQKIIEYEKRSNKFCSHSCSATIINSTRTCNRKITSKKTYEYSKVKFILCKETNKWYCNKNSNGNSRRRSPYIKFKKENYNKYSAFLFNVYTYPKEFDLDLIKTHGWYTCPGKKRKHYNKNINGVSRDHLISKSDGYKNNYDPLVLAHPANCKLVLHSENKKKGSSSSITYDELLRRIEVWNLKYNT